MKNTQLLFFILLFVGLETSAQKVITRQNLYWIRYYNQFSINKKLVWHNEFEERRFLLNNRHYHFIMHTRLHFKVLPNLDVGGGFTYSLQSPQFEQSMSNLIVPEIRPVQEMNISNPISKRFTLQHRFRLDERFIHKNDGKELLNGYDFNFRVRYRLQANFLVSNEKAKNPTSIKLANELMINAGKNIIYNQFDQYRFSLGIEKAFNKSVSAELGGIHWYQQRASGKDFFARNILRITLLHKI